MEIRLERLLSTRVVDPDGRYVGRIEEVHARQAGGEVIVTEFVLGAAGFVERLALGPILLGILGRFYRGPERYRVAREDVDLDDPERPRLRRRLEDLERNVRDGERARRRRASA
jgi:hypothetical protein